MTRAMPNLQQIRLTIDALRKRRDAIPQSPGNWTERHELFERIDALYLQLGKLVKAGKLG